jgi:hypothetical protein
MIAVFKEAADVAADAGDRFNRVQISLCRAGVTVIGNVQALQGNTTFTETVLWSDLLTDPQTLLAKVNQVAGVVDRWCDDKPVIRPFEAGEKPAVRLIEPEDWPVVGMTAAVLALCLPLVLGIYP